MFVVVVVFVSYTKRKIVKKSRMGATASINTDDFSSVAPPEFCLNEFTWINISHTLESQESFSSVRI